MRAFGEVLVENRRRKGYSQADLVDLLAQEGIEVTTKAVSKWENLTREPSLHTILTVCQILDIEDIYEEFLGENPFDHVMENLNEDGKAKIIEFANLLRASRKYLPHRADIIPFENYQPIAVEPASAGTGNYIEDSVKESYNVGHLAPERRILESVYLVTVWNQCIIPEMLHGFINKTVSPTVKSVSSISMAIPISKSYMTVRMEFIWFH